MAYHNLNLLPTSKNYNVYFIVLAILVVFVLITIYVTKQSYYNENYTNYPPTTNSTHNPDIFLDYYRLIRNNLFLDYYRLVDINFTFKYLPLVCGIEKIPLIILVHSSPDNFDKRKTIRETWAQKSQNVSVLFLIGLVEKEDIKKKIAKENEIHKDFVEGTFLDSYHNLTYKHVMVLKYVFYHCPNVQFVVKVDDDVFVNTPNLKSFLKLYYLENGQSKNILCSRMYGNPVLREGRWGVSKEEYPGTVYPNHCSGFAVIFPLVTVQELYQEAQRSKYFWVDDAHVTGTLAKSSGITHTGIEKLILTGQDVNGIVDHNFKNITKPFLFGRMNMNEHQIRSLWNFVVQLPPKVSILDYLN